MPMEFLSYQADGLLMRSQLYVEGAQRGRRPGVLVFPEAFGLGDHAAEVAQKLAKLGYVALACDLHGNGSLVTDFGVLMPIMETLRKDAERIRARSKGALDTLRARPEVDPTRIAAIGYCFGGSMALELARNGSDIVGVVGFHSGLTTPAPDDAKNIKGKILICIGADDPQVGADARTAFEDEMRRAKVDWRMNIYGGVTHSFTNRTANSLGKPESFRYDAKADARSWSEMLVFLDEVFGEGA